MAKKTLKKGLFITFEGPEGCGKSTHSRRIYEFLKKEGYDCIHTREPGGTNLGEKVRDILLDVKNTSISVTTELMLFETARSQIVSEIILPALKAKQIVICDRFSDSTVVYQGYAGKLSKQDIYAVDKIATGGLEPDLTVLLDVDVKTGLKRAASHKKKDRMELKALAYHTRVRNGYLDLAKKNRKRFAVVRSGDDIEVAYAAVKGIILKHLKVK